MRKKEWLQRLRRCLFGAGTALGCEIALLMLCAALTIWEIVGEESGEKCVWLVTALCSCFAANYSAAEEKKAYLRILGSGMLLALLLGMGMLFGGAPQGDRVRAALLPTALGCALSLLLGGRVGKRKGEHKKSAPKRRHSGRRRM